MVNLAVYGPIVGEAVAQAAQGLEDVYDPLSTHNQQRRQAAAQQYLLPLETQAAQVGLQQKIRSANQPTFHPFAGGYALVYPDGRVEPHAWSAGVGVKQTAATRKLQELAVLARSSDPKEAAAAQGELDRLSHPQDPKEFSMRQRWFAMQRQEIPYDPALDNYVQMKILGEIGHYPERGFDLGLVPSLQGTNILGGQSGLGASPAAPSGAQPAATGAPPDLLRLTDALTATEGTPGGQTSYAGAMSKYQIKPETALPYMPQGTTLDQAKALLSNEGTARYYAMRHIDHLNQKYHGNPQAVAAAYFSGEGNVKEDGTIIDPSAHDANMTVAQYVQRFTQKYQGGGQVPAATPPVAGTSPALVQSIQKIFAGISQDAAKQALDQYKREAPSTPTARAAEQAYNNLYGQKPPAVPAAQPAAPAAQAPLLQGRQGQSPRYTAQTVVEQARALGFGHQEIAAAQQLFPYKAFSELTAEDVKQVRQTIEDIKNKKGFQQVFRQASPLIGELNSLDEAASMAKELEPLITPERVGMRGRAKRFSQGIAYQYPDYAKSLGLTFDSAIQDIETLSHIIGYMHANAVKRGAGGGVGMRGVTAYDLRAIEAWLDPFAMTATAPGLKTSLARIQQVIQHMRPQVENDLRVLGVDPQTKGPLARNYGGVVIPEAMPAPPQAAPPEGGAETPEPTGNDLLGRE